MLLNISILVLLISSILSFILAVYVLKRRHSLGTSSLGGVLVTIALWTFAAGLELIVKDQGYKLGLTIACYFSIVQLPIWFFLFATEFTGLLGRVSNLHRFLLWVFPAINFVGLLTNSHHNLFFTKITVESVGTTEYLVINYGIWWWLHTTYSYLLIFSGLFLFILALFNSTPQQRFQIKILLLSSTIPVVANIIYSAGIRPIPYLDLTAVAFAITGGLFFWGIYSKNMFSVKPIALDTLFANLPDGIIVLDENLILIDINQSAISMLGLDDQKVNGESIEKVFFPFKEIFEESNKFPKEIEFNRRTFEFSHSPMINHYGQKVGLLLIFRDVSERKLAKTELQATRDRFELAIMAAGLDPWENNFVTGKRIGGQKLFHDLGYDQEDTPKTLDEIFNLIHPDDIKQVKQSINNHIVGKTDLYTSDFRIKDKSEGYQWVTNFGRVVERDENGRAIRFIGLTLNINDRKKTEEKIRKQNEDLLRANAEKDKFFSIIAHDLKGPFQGFIGLTEIMSESITEMTKEEIQEISQTLQGTAKNLYELLENLLNWAMVKRGHKRFDIEKVRLSAIADTVIEMLRNQVSQKELSVKNNIETAIDILADKEAVRTIFRNLISNAVKFTPRGGSITIKSKSLTNGFVEVAVQDTGIGMPFEITENLFKLNQKVSRPGTEKEPSTGLGLILCKEFIEKHGGKIWVTSQPNEGSTFSFTLPLATFNS